MRSQKPSRSAPGVALSIRILSLGAGLLGLGWTAAAETVAPVPTDAALKLLETHCYECHGDGMDKGSFALDGLLEVGVNETNRFQWVKAWKIIRDGFMPPSDADPLPNHDRKQITRWIEQDRLGIDYANPDPGRVTLRRLNRMEYEFTIQDLFGVSPEVDGEFSSDSTTAKSRLRDLLPPDDTAFGFDNNGDFQTLAPALLEKYFNLAELVVDHVVVSDGPLHPERMVDTGGIRAERKEANGTKVTEQTLEFETATAGKHRVDFQFTLGGWQEFGGGFDFTLALDGQPMGEQGIEVGGQRVYKFSKELDLPAGKHRLAFSMVATKPNSSGNLVHQELRPRVRLTGPIIPGVGVYPEAHRRIFFKGEAPADAAARRTYAREILQRVADRAFRRPTPDPMLDRLTDLAMGSEKFEEGIGLGLMAILTSPQFIFRSEVQPRPDDPKSVHPLDEFALASRLSYFLWLSLPDDELFGLARRGELRKNLAPQLKRMLADAKAERFFEDFPGQWLRTRNVLMTPITRADALDAVRSSMKRETEMLFEHIARNDRDLLELVTADYTFLDEKLAKFYGLPAPDGGGFQKVALSPESNRGGILTHGSFLVSTSNPNRTSPVKRGLFVLENLLAIHPPPPPPSVPALEDLKVVDRPLPKTGSEQLALHRADKSCAACHAHFDPIGIALENFSLTGQWRTQDAGEPIAPNEKTTTGQTLTGIGDIKRMFVDRKDQFYHGVSEKLLTYSLGRGLDPSDAVIVDRIAHRVASEGGKFSTLLLAVVESPQFQLRRGDDGALKTPPRSIIPEAPPPEKRKGRRRPPRANPENVPTNDIPAVVSPAAVLPVPNPSTAN